MNHTGNDGRCRRAPVSPVAVIALVMFTATLSSNLPSPRYVLYQQRFAFSAATLTYVFSAYAVAVLVALVTVGRASDRVGRKRVIVPALVLLVVSALVFMTADGTASLVAARAVQGLATGTLTAAATAALVELEPGHDRRRASYISTASFITGAAFGPLLSGLLMQYAPWPRVLPFLVQLGLLAVALVLMRAVPETVHAAPGIRWRLQRLSVPAPIRRAFAAASCTLAASWAVAVLYASLSPSTGSCSAGPEPRRRRGAPVRLQRPGRARPGPPSALAEPADDGRRGRCAFGRDRARRLEPDRRERARVRHRDAARRRWRRPLLYGQPCPPQRCRARHRRAEVVAAYSIVGYVALTAPVIGVGLLADSVGLQRATQASRSPRRSLRVGAVAHGDAADGVAARARRRLDQPWPRRSGSAHEVSDVMAAGHARLSRSAGRH